MNSEGQQLICCVCYRNQGDNYVQFSDYIDNQDQYQDLDYFVICDQCTDGRYCIPCLSQLPNNQCAICRIPMMINQQSDDEELDYGQELEEAIEQTIETIEISIIDEETPPFIQVSFDFDPHFDEAGYQFQYDVLFSIGDEFYQSLINSQQLEIFATTATTQLYSSNGFNNHLFHAQFADQTNYFGIALMRFFSVNLEQALCDLIRDNDQNMHFLHNWLQHGGIIHQSDDQLQLYCNILFQEGVPFSVQIQENGINHFTLRIHIGPLNDNHRTITINELNTFNAF